MFVSLNRSISAVANQIRISYVKYYLIQASRMQQLDACLFVSYVILVDTWSLREGWAKVLEKAAVFSEDHDCSRIYLTNMCFEGKIKWNGPKWTVNACLLHTAQTAVWNQLSDSGIVGWDGVFSHSSSLLCTQHNLAHDYLCFWLRDASASSPHSTSLPYKWDDNAK